MNTQRGLIWLVSLFMIAVTVALLASADRLAAHAAEAAAPPAASASSPHGSSTLIQLTDLPENVDMIAEIFVDSSALGIMTQPVQVRFARVLSIFRLPMVINGQVAAAFSKISAYNCARREIAIMYAAFFSYQGEVIQSSVRPGPPIGVDQGEPTSRESELNKVCSLPTDKFTNVDGPSGPKKLQELFFDVQEEEQEKPLTT